MSRLSQLSQLSWLSLFVSVFQVVFVVLFVLVVLVVVVIPVMWFRWFLLSREPRINGDAIRCIGLCAVEIGMVLKSSGVKFGMVVGCFGLT